MQTTIGDIFAETIEDLHQLGLSKVRVIKPLSINHMIRFDVLINISRQSVEVCNVLIYKRGDKHQEKRALDGDRA